MVADARVADPGCTRIKAKIEAAIDHLDGCLPQLWPQASGKLGIEPQRLTGGKVLQGRPARPKGAQLRVGRVGLETGIAWSRIGVPGGLPEAAGLDCPVRPSPLI